MSLYSAMFMASPLTPCFSDTALLQGMLDFEAGLAQALASAGIIDDASARIIRSHCQAEKLDAAALTQSAGLAGNLAIPLVKQLTALVAQTSPEAARFVHWGATSQDAIDSGLMLQLRSALDKTDALLNQLIAALTAQCRRHSATLMVGRTWLQHALPTTLGLKLAGTLDALLRYRARLAEMRPRVLALQFGGAAGTLAALGDNGLAVAEALARELDLPLPDAPWHTHRDGIAEAASVFAILSGACGKIARDVQLLMQTDVAEAFEPSGAGRGGSSTMPHKRNPVATAAAIAAATMTPNLAATIFAAQIQDHERSAGAWHAEWPTLPALMLATSGALAAIVDLAEGLEIDRARMAQNLDATHGLIMAEAVTFALADKIGKSDAHHLVEAASKTAVATKTHLRDVLKADKTVTAHLDAAAIAGLFDPMAYQGVAQQLIDRLLSSVEDKNA